MLSVSKLKGPGNDLVDYCESDLSALCSGDYCSGGGNPLAQLIGDGWTMLGRPSYSHDIMANILDGKDPLTGDKVARPLPNRVTGFDLTFTAPKSVSAIWALSSRMSVENTSLHNALDIAHHQAVKCAIAHLERHVIYSRQGKAGVNLQRYQSRIFGAAYLHGASRAGDPNQHTHVLVANFVQRPDGSFGALDAAPMLRHKIAAGAVYRSVYAAGLKQMGFRIERDGMSFKITGVPSALIDEWSKRREQITDELTKHGVCSSKAAEFAALNTRPGKLKHTATELQQRWFNEADQHGFTTESIRKLMSIQVTTEQLQMPSHDEIIALLSKGIPKFDEHKIYSVVAQAAQGITNTEGIEQYASELMSSPELVKITAKNGRENYTTLKYYLWEQEAKDVLERYLARLASETETNHYPESPSMGLQPGTE